MSAESVNLLASPLHHIGGTGYGLTTLGQGGHSILVYWHRPEETAATLTAQGWLRTGDAAYRDAQGYLFLHDRTRA